MEPTQYSVTTQGVGAQNQLCGYYTDHKMYQKACEGFW